MDQQTLKSKVHYDPMTGLFTWAVTLGVRAKAGDVVPGRMTSKGYHRFQIDGRKYMAHRLAWLYVYGEWPTQIDHKNRVKGDNRIDNLRDVTTMINSQNRGLRVDNKTGVAGVHYRPKPLGKDWHAEIVANRKRTLLGSFYTREEAVAARLTAEKIMHELEPQVPCYNCTSATHPLDA